MMRPGNPAYISSSSTGDNRDPENAWPSFQIGDTTRPFQGYASSTRNDGYFHYIITKRSFGENVTLKASFKGPNYAYSFFPGLMFAAQGWTEGYPAGYVGYLAVMGGMDRARFERFSWSVEAVLGTFSFPNVNTLSWLTMFASRGSGTSLFTFSYGVDGQYTSTCADGSATWATGRMGVTYAYYPHLIQKFYVVKNTEDVDFWMKDYALGRQQKHTVLNLVNNATGRVQVGSPTVPLWTINAYLPTMTTKKVIPGTGYYVENNETRLNRYMDNKDLVVVETPVWTTSGYITDLQGPKQKPGTNRGIGEFTFTLQEVRGCVSNSNG